MALVLSDRQEAFCQYYIKEGLSKGKAAQKAGYRCSGSTGYANRGTLLLELPLVDQRIKELRDEKFDKETVFKTVIEKYYAVLSLRIGEYTHSVQEVTDTGKKYNFLWVKPYEEWDDIAKLLLEDWAKDGHPIFMSKTNALKELSRIFGLYSDNLASSVQDLAKVLESAGLSTGLSKSELETIGETASEPDYVEDDDDDLTDEDKLADEEDETVNFTNDGVETHSADTEQSYQFEDEDEDDDDYVDDYSI